MPKLLRVLKSYVYVVCPRNIDVLRVSKYKTRLEKKLESFKFLPFHSRMLDTNMLYAETPTRYSIKRIGAVFEPCLLFELKSRWTD